MNREEKLLAWVTKQHEGQLIKHTTEPYLNHLTTVAEMAAIIPFGYEIGLCHDLFEETEIDPQQLQVALVSFDYNNENATFITACVVELTDIFTKKAYPDLNKKLRKEKEAERLSGISPAAQTVKYADLIYNISWMWKYDTKHAKKYLKKKRLLLAEMQNGDETLRHRAMLIIDNALAELAITK